MWYECTLPANGQSPPKQYRGQLGSWLLAQRTKIKRESSALGPGEPMTQQMIERAAAFQLLVDEGMYFPFVIVFVSYGDRIQ